MRVREAVPADRLEVRRIVDAAALEPGDVEARIAAGDVLVAVEPREGDAGRDGRPDDRATRRDARLLGALVLEPRERGAHVGAVAVRRRRRDRGVGTALVEAATERAGRLTARFDTDVVPFYESLSFAIEPIGDDRYRGVRTV